MKRVLGILLVVLLLAVPSLVFADKMGNFEIQDFTASVPDVSVEPLENGRCEVTLRGLHGYGTVAGLDIVGSDTVPVELIQNLRLLVDSENGRVRGRVVGTLTFAEPINGYETVQLNVPLRGRVRGGEEQVVMSGVMRGTLLVPDIAGEPAVVGRMEERINISASQSLCDPVLETEGLNLGNSSATGRIRLRTQ